jgi:protocatechuate 3,4-dioxygenase beta subunit
MRIVKMAALATGLFIGVVSAVPANELAGTVRDVCGPVLPGTSVSAANGFGSTARVFTDERGHYSFSALAPGQWTIAFALTGFDTLQQTLRLPENGDAIQLNVRLLPDLLLKQELTVSDADPTVRYRRFSVYGVVKGRSGEPIPSALVRLQDVGSKKSRGTSPCTADELGRYAITAWSPVETTWQLSVQADGFRSYTHPDFTLAPDQPKSIDLPLERGKPAPNDRVEGAFLTGTLSDVRRCFH